MTPESMARNILASRRRMLAIWLKEWRIHNALPVESVLDRPGAPPEAGGAWGKGAREGSGDLRVGQVRLLRPGNVEAAQIRPVYVAILKGECETTWLVAPFSRFANPAVPGEWLTGIRLAPLRVLCLWNARVVTEETLRQTWLCRRLTVVQVARGIEVWRHCREGTDPKGALTRRVGAPVVHPLDPRHKYLVEERELLDAHLILTRTEDVPETTPLYEILPSEQRKAAEERSKYGEERD